MGRMIKEMVVQDCPIRNVLARVCDKWSLLVIYTLNLATSSTFWCRCISLISPIPCNDPYDDSHYVRHSILYPNSTSALGWQISHIVL